MILEFPTDLPRPGRTRWQPLRGGLLNLYRYDHEVFQYEDGRLLLRGNNGTGKSRVLALQLPFLLDGEIAPTRLEPDADPAKRIEWNLLMGRHPERLGYTWLEFGRQGEDGAEHFLTLGCGLHALEGRGAPNRWFFVTPRRVGRDLFLQARAGNALSREALAEALGDAGQVYTRVADYRAAVDRELFGLGPERYESLLNLLIQLRQPQLSRNLDERRLSAALRDALPRVSTLLLEEVAEAFRTLDDERNTLARYRAAHAGAESFLVEYQRYARIAARQRGEGLRTAQSRYEARMGELRQARQDLETARQRVEETTRRLAELELAEEEATTTVRALRESPQMQDVGRLDEVRREAEEKRRAAERAGQEGAAARERLGEAEAERAREEERDQESRARVLDRSTRAGEAAREVGLERAWEREAPALGAEEPTLAGVHQARHRLGEELRRRREAAGELRRLARLEGRCRSELDRARDRQDLVATELEQAREQHAEAHRALQEARERLVARLRAWVGDLVELELEDPEELEGELEDWEQGESPVAPRLRQALERALNRLATRRAAAEGNRDLARGREQELQAEREALRSGKHLPPPAPPTRDADRRASRSGAPLWRLCDFAEGLPEEHRAGLEAALEASGLLDAWVTPGGELLSPGDHDTVLALGRSPRLSQHLGSVLVPCVDPASGVDEATVAGLLESVGLGEGSGPLWVDVRGAWGAGPLAGAWSKPAPEHVGEVAREARRRQRLLEVEAELEKVRAHLQALEEELLTLRRRQACLDAEVQAAPSEDEVLRARSTLAVAAEAEHRKRQQYAEREAEVLKRRAEHLQAREELDRTAGELHLARWVEDLSGLDAALSRCEVAFGELGSALERRVEASEALARARARRDAASEHLEEREALAFEALRAAREAAANRDVLESSLGASAREILARLEQAQDRERNLREERKHQDKARGTAEVARGQAETRVESLAGELDERAEARDQKVRDLEAFAGTRLLGVAIPALAEAETGSWSVTRAVEVARRIEAALGEVATDPEAWNRSQRDIHHHLQRLQEALSPQGFSPEAYMDQGLLVVAVPFQGRSCTAADLRDALASEVETRQSLLTHREREVLENHLLGEVASHLHERIRGAERLVTEMNAELSQRPTSTGMALRFAWDLLEDGPSGLREARTILLRSDSTWSPEHRKTLGRFLQDRIAEVRSKQEGGSWREHLEQALDYRSWHQFSVERKQDGQWKRLTRRTHGTGSGGEKAIALTV